MSPGLEPADASAPARRRGGSGRRGRRRAIREEGQNRMRGEGAEGALTASHVLGIMLLRQLERFVDRAADAAQGQYHMV